MKTSGNSSAPSPPSRSVSTPTRKRFALTGRSRVYDPTTTAARRDLADVRVADRIFAPHYAAPMPRALATDSSLTGSKGGETIRQLHKGETFEVLEITAEHAWGVAAASGRVGYVALSALVPA